MKNILEFNKLMSDKLFDIEHSLGMYATSYCTMPAEAIYDKSVLNPLMDVINTCHIYLIGLTPIIDFVDAKQVDSLLTLSYKIIDQRCDLCFKLPEGHILKSEEGVPYIETRNSQRIWPEFNSIQALLSDKTDNINFEVKYVGQAYGKDGSRNAIDRLLKHETL